MIMKAALAAALLAGSLGAAADSVVEQGKQVAFDRKKGNCLTCHQMEGGTLAGNWGPPLMAMKARYPNKEDLRAQIWDPTKRNPMTSMPPFGRNGILTEAEIDLVVEFVHSL
mgnify:CR=1 FL=1